MSDPREFSKPTVLTDSRSTAKQHYLRAYRDSKAIQIAVDVVGMAFLALTGFFWAQAAWRSGVLLFCVGIGFVGLRRWSEVTLRGAERRSRRELLRLHKGNMRLQSAFAEEVLVSERRACALAALTKSLQDTTASLASGESEGIPMPDRVRTIVGDVSKWQLRFSAYVQEVYFRLQGQFPRVRFFVTLWRLDSKARCLQHECSWSWAEGAPNLFALDRRATSLATPTGSPMAFLATSLASPHYVIASLRDLGRDVPFHFPPDRPEARNEIRSVLCHRVGTDIPTTAGIVSVFADKDGTIEEGDAARFKRILTPVRDACLCIEHEYASLNQLELLHGCLERDRRTGDARTGVRA